MKLHKLNKIVANWPRVAALAAIAVIIGATSAPLASPTVASAQAAKPLLAPTPPPPPTPTKSDKPQKGVQGIKGTPPSTSGVSTLAACSTICYSYAGGYYTNATAFAAVSSNVRIAKPAIDSVDAHTLAEISAEKVIGGQRQIVEVGWSVDPATFGDSNPHLFVFRWINGSPGCYNGCGWVDYSGNATNAGADLSADIGTQQQMIIQYSGSSWWIWYKNGWIGHFPGSLWTNAGVSGFTNMTTTQTFGEIAARHNPTCTDMGNGNFASTSGTYPSFGADFGSLNTGNGTTFTLTPYTGTIVTDASKWNVLLITPPAASSLRYGGPGATTCP